MKKIILLITLISCIALTACSKTEVNTNDVVVDTNSNITDTEVNTTVETTRIMPLASTIDMENLNDCTVAVSLNEGDAYVDDTGMMKMKVTVFDYDLYDMVDIASLKEGDTIVIGNHDIVISSIERNDLGLVMINGGLEQGGFDLATNDDGVYFEVGFNDAKTYYVVGETEISVSTEFKYIDSSDLEAEPKEYFPGDFLVEDAGIEYNFNPNNTKIVIQDGKIIEMNRVFVP